MVTRRGKEKVEAAEAKEMEEGSREIVRTIGPDTLRSIETTETTVTAMTAEIARHKMKDTDVAEMHTEIGTSQKKIGGRPAGSPVLIAGKTGKKNASEIAVGTVTGTWTDWGQGWTRQNNRSWQNDDREDRRPSRRSARAPPGKVATEHRAKGRGRYAAPNPERPERIAQQIVKSPGRMPAPRPDETNDGSERDGSQPGEETSQEATYGAAIEGWISALYDEEEDDLIREILDSVIQVHWETNEPDFDRVMRHFYPREIPKHDRSEEDALEWEDRREEPPGSRRPDHEVEWTEEEEGVEGVEAVPETPPPAPPAQQSLRFAPYHFDYPPQRLEYKYDTKVSKRLSVVLRHDKGEFNLHFYQNATAELDAILDLPIMQEVRARQDTIISCVYYNSKQRFRLLRLHDPTRSGPVLVLGAVQGHSKAVDYDSVHERVDPGKVPDLIHGTHYDFYKKIYKEGLLPGAGNRDYRDQIHLFDETNLGSRLLPPKCDIILHIDPALATGCRFYKSANGYYLTGEKQELRHQSPRPPQGGAAGRSAVEQGGVPQQALRRLQAPEELIAAVIALHDTSAYHIHVSSTGSTKPKDSPVVPVKPTVTGLACPECGVYFTSNGSVKEHIKRMHPAIWVAVASAWYRAGPWRRHMKQDHDAAWQAAQTSISSILDRIELSRKGSRKAGQAAPGAAYGPAK
ncbi:TRPT1, partial [Symbiodinium microadriaticum]